MSIKNTDSQPITGSPAPGVSTTSTVNAPAVPPTDRTDPSPALSTSEKSAKTSSKVGATWVFLFLGMLLAAIAGALIMTLIGSVRIIQLRRQVARSTHKDTTKL